MNAKIRPAVPEEANMLSRIAFSAKAHLRVANIARMHNIRLPPS